MKSLVTLEIPSKTFLIGEYLALKGTSSLILSSGPSFQISVGEGNLGFAEESPAGQFLKKNKLNDFSFEMSDPHKGKGGFGRSTAEFLAAYTFKKIKDAESNFDQVSNDMSADLKLIIDEYRLCAGSDYKPSGADLIAQMTGGLCLYDGMNFTSEAKEWPFKGYNLLVFHTGKKLKTHDHLKNLGEKDFQDLIPLLLRSLMALQGGKLKAFCEALDNYYDKLNEYGLSDSEVRKKVLELRQEPEVLCAKGCGAMGVDTVALIVQDSDFDRVNSLAKKQGFDFVTSMKEVHEGLKEVSS